MSVPEIRNYSGQEIEGGIVIRYEARQPGETDWQAVRVFSPRDASPQEETMRNDRRLRQHALVRVAMKNGTGIRELKHWRAEKLQAAIHDVLIDAVGEHTLSGDEARRVADLPNAELQVEIEALARTGEREE